jgi:glycerol-3-phosphate responsive antiterminator
VRLPELGRPRLPQVFVADDIRHGPVPRPAAGMGHLLRDADLPAVVREASESGAVLAIDIDTIAGLGADEAAVEFVIGRLGIRIVLTRRPQLAACAAEHGGLGLTQVLAFDSTGIRRTLEAHPRLPGVGTVISPGLVLGHLRPDELDSLPRPLLAYGLIGSLASARAILRCADSIVVRPDVATLLSGGNGLWDGSAPGT